MKRIKTKRIGLIVEFFAAFVLLLNSSKAYEQSHPLSQIHPIDVSLNMYGFNVTNASYIGVGTAVPAYPLDVYGSGRFTGNLYVGGTIYGNLNGEIVAGGNLNMMGYDIFNATNVNATNVFVSNSLYTNSILQTSSGWIEIGRPGYNGTKFNQGSWNLYIGWNARIYPSQDNLVSLGLSSNAWKEIYGYNLYTNQISELTSGNGITVVGNVIPQNDNTYNLGSSSLRWKNVYAVNVYASNINGGSPVTGSGTTNYIPIWTGSNTLGSSIIYQPNTQEIGIGTTSPENSANWNRVLELYGDNHARFIVGTSSIRTVVTSHNSGFYGAPAGGIIGTETSHPLSFITGSSVRMTITSSGDVGIGTTNPQGKLDVAGSIVLNDTNTQIYRVGDTMWIKGKGISLDISPNGGGQLRISNNPNDNKIYLEGFSSDGSSDADEILITGRYAGDLPKFTIKADTTYIDGSVGIGVNSPSSKLTVQGSFNATSNGGTLQVTTQGDVKVGI